MNFKLALVKNKNRVLCTVRPGTAGPGSIPVWRPDRRELFLVQPMSSFSWGFSVNQGISCPGVNQEKLPAKCLPFRVMVGGCLASGFPQLPCKNSLSPWQQISWDNRQFLFFFFVGGGGCGNWFKKADLAFLCRLLGNPVKWNFFWF